MFVLVSTERVMVCPATEDHARCEIRAVIRFLRAKTLNAVELCRELWAEVYFQNVTSPPPTPLLVSLLDQRKLRSE
jgi:hypothetical protein